MTTVTNRWQSPQPQPQLTGSSSGLAAIQQPSMPSGGTGLGQQQAAPFDPMEAIRRALQGFQAEQYLLPENQTLPGSRFETPSYDGQRPIGMNDMLAAVGANQRSIDLGEVSNLVDGLYGQLAQSMGATAQMSDGENRIAAGPYDHGMVARTTETRSGGYANVPLENFMRMKLKDNERILANPDQYSPEQVRMAQGATFGG